MADYTRWWQYIIILSVVGFVIFVVFQTYFVYVPIERIESQVYFTTDLLNDAAESAERIEKKIDATLTVIEPLITPVVRFLCGLLCEVVSVDCPTATFEYCQSILPTGTTGGNTRTVTTPTRSPHSVPIGPTGAASTIGYYMHRAANLK